MELFNLPETPKARFIGNNKSGRVVGRFFLIIDGKEIEIPTVTDLEIKVGTGIIGLCNVSMYVDLMEYKVDFEEEV
jgi:hypothetical protein